MSAVRSGLPAGTGDRDGRCRHLVVRNNPRVELDFVVILDGGVHAGNRIEMRYVPDKLILAHPSFGSYLANLADRGEAPPEAIALTVLDDINNEVVPRWIQVTVASTDAQPPTQRTIVEDRQPNWANHGILENLPSR